MTNGHGGIEVAVFTNAKDRKGKDGPLTKHISLTAEGTINSDGSACTMVRGQAARVRLAGLAEFAALIAELKPSQAITLGALRPDLDDTVQVTTKLKLNGSKGVIARTADHLVYQPGRPALLLLDFDMKGMSEVVAAKLNELGGFWQALVSVLPTLKEAAHVVRHSTSAGLRRTDTGEQFPGSGGLHVYLMARDGTDAERFLKTLHQRCWLNGLGWMMVGGGGQLLERSIIDRMVGAPERLVFEGPPIVVPPLTQDVAARRPVVTEGGMVDTVTACPPLTNAEYQQYAAAKAAETAGCMPAAQAQRKAYVDAHAKALAKRKGLPLEQAEHIVEHQVRGMLLPDVVLEFDHKELAGCTVGAVLADPKKFKGRTLADPIEGRSYGRCKAMVMVDGMGTPWIKSFAHGGAKYALVHEAPPDWLKKWASFET
jgi:hypothetical protein